MFAPNERVAQLLNNTLAEVAKTWQGTKQEYLTWLRLEVGFTLAELISLDEEGLLPMPVEYEEERA